MTAEALLPLPDGDEPDGRGQRVAELEDPVLLCALVEAITGEELDRHAAQPHTSTDMEIAA